MCITFFAHLCCTPPIPTPDARSIVYAFVLVAASKGAELPKGARESGEKVLPGQVPQALASDGHESVTEGGSVVVR